MEYLAACLYAGQPSLWWSFCLELGAALGTLLRCDLWRCFLNDSTALAVGLVLYLHMCPPPPAYNTASGIHTVHYCNQ